MDFAELDATVQTLTRDRDRLREDLDRLRREFDQLDGKLRYPGTKFLVDLEYKLVYEGTITAPLNSIATQVIQTLPGALHALYALAAYATETGILVLTDGGGAGPPGSLAVRLGRQRLAA